MAPPPDVALEHYAAQAALAVAAEQAAAQMWGSVDPADIARSWAAQLARIEAVTAGAQLAAASLAEPYLEAAAALAGAAFELVPTVAPRAFAGIASDGRDLTGLLFQPAVASLLALRNGADTLTALATGLASLRMMVHTQVADMGRAAVSAGLVGRRGMDGYVRVAVGKTCSRCIVLAGKFYRYNTGFDRHPKCDCIHLPTTRAQAAGIVQDPRRVFDSLSREEQDRTFTKAGARAIRDGADISRVVNARRGAAGLTPASGGRLTEAEKRAARRGRDRGRLARTRVFGREHFITSEATTKRGINRKIRLMPESIYEIAGHNRDEAIRLLRLHGYLIGP